MTAVRAGPARDRAIARTHGIVGVVDGGELAGGTPSAGCRDLRPRHAGGEADERVGGAEQGHEVDRVAHQGGGGAGVAEREADLEQVRRAVVVDQAWKTPPSSNCAGRASCSIRCRH